MSRIEQWIAFAIAVVTLGGAVLGGTYWYVSKEAPALIQAELDKRAVSDLENKPDEIVAALSELSTKVDALTTEQAALKLEITENFKFLIEKVMAL